MNNEYVIEVNDVKKYFKIYADKGATAKEKFYFGIEINMRENRF